MSDITYEKLQKRVSGHLNPRLRELGKTVEEINRYFKSLGLETAVWLPERIHTANLGGVQADSYIGYSRVEGRWGLLIRTIERDPATQAFMGQRVFTIEACTNAEIVVNALEKVRSLVLLVHETIENQIKKLEQVGSELHELRSPECKFR